MSINIGLVSKHLIYALCHPTTKERRYVGKSSSGLSMPRRHGRDPNLKKHSHLPVVHWIVKLRSKGLDYIIEIIEEFPNEPIKAELDAREIYWIAQNGGPIWEPGSRLLNCTEGGDGARRPKTENEIRLTRERMKGNQLSKGRPRSKESNDLMVQNNPCVRAVRDDRGNEYFSINEAARVTKINVNTIRKSITEDRPLRSGIRFFYLVEMEGERGCLKKPRKPHNPQWIKENAKALRESKSPEPPREYQRSDSMRAKVSILKTGNTNCLGKKWSDQTRATMRLSNPFRKPVEDSDGNTYPSLALAGAEHGISRKTIANAIKANRPVAKIGKTFKYIEK